MRRPASTALAMASEEAQLAHPISASYTETVGEANESDLDPHSDNEDTETKNSWWDVLRVGKHDQKVFVRHAEAGGASEQAKEELKDKNNAAAVRIIPSPSCILLTLPRPGRGKRT